MNTTLESVAAAVVRTMIRQGHRTAWVRLDTVEGHRALIFISTNNDTADLAEKTLRAAGALCGEDLGTIDVALADKSMSKEKGPTTMTTDIAAENQDEDFKPVVLFSTDEARIVLTSNEPDYVFERSSSVDAMGVPCWSRVEFNTHSADEMSAMLFAVAGWFRDRTGR